MPTDTSLLGHNQPFGICIVEEKNSIARAGRLESENENVILEHTVRQ